MFRWLPLLILLIFSFSVNAQKYRAENKLAPGLTEYSKRVTDSFEVSVSILNSDKSGVRSFTRKISSSELNVLLRDSTIIFMSLVHPPVEELTTGASDLSLNSITYSRHRWPMLDGSTLMVAIKERQFDSTDIDLKGRVYKTGLEHIQQTAHASLMTTIIAGAANSSPFAQGAAPAAEVGSTSFDRLFADPDSVLRNRSISVQNHSYGTTIENFYGNEAYTYDQQAHSIPTLVHVFSAGNSGTSASTSGTYSGLSSFANLSGNFKQAKNLITVGSVDSSGMVMPLSSRGPAYDGRVKPELVAYGEDGSSGAAALVSGTALLIQDAYKRIHNHLPSASLVKAVLLNGADDIGAPGIDYTSGYGSLDAYNSINTVVQGHYIEDSIHLNEVKQYSLTVPPGLYRLKITVTWTDPASAINSPKALQNNLDSKLSKDGLSGEWLPWVLNRTPNINALQALPQRKVDTLNTVEQITVDLPDPGNYTLNIIGTQLVNSSQIFSVAYQMDTLQEFYWTYPVKQLISGTIQWLRWQTNRTGTGIIEYTTGGGIWQVVNTTNLSDKNYRWPVPETVSTALLRMRFPSGDMIVSDTITISSLPNLEMGFNCADTFLFYWNQSGSYYRVYELKEKYLESFSETADSFLVLNKNLHNSIYYSIAPLINGREGIRSYTLNISSSDAFCYLKAFYLQLQTNQSARFFAQLGTLYGVSSVTLEKYRPGTGFTSLEQNTSLQSANFIFTDSNLSKGLNLYRLKVLLTNGQVIYSVIEKVYHFNDSPVIVYPNPVSQGKPVQVLSNESGRYVIEFLDMSGRKMTDQSLNSTVSGINTSTWAKGIYLVRIKDNKGGQWVQKLLVY